MTEVSNTNWNDRYINNQTGWDIGHSNEALIKYIKTVHPNTQIKILIPGAGRAYEAEDLFKAGYQNVFVSDIAPKAKEQFLDRVKDFPEDNYMVGDFFAIEDQYDVILEQTFFCALDPAMRTRYVNKMKGLLKPGGKLAGVLFSVEMNDGPPFGGNRTEYEGLFSPHFEILKLEPCYNSIKPRKGKEYFVEFMK